ncbi:hypothetical protein KPNJ2_02748 [Klebsiella pneumoniae 30684/NJST258_2]|uniref:Uncharacterized protein n=1 Tax=Klebsiella pneumoniae 30684/NJST258_2 TaxID=1420013 RepID=W8UV51_KLEPN|nr:hypothetical protein KPNJ2_02748 [Klebsiella pneumoniae 30684/NJST258_2]
MTSFEVINLAAMKTEIHALRLGSEDQANNAEYFNNTFY